MTIDYQGKQHLLERKSFRRPRQQEPLFVMAGGANRLCATTPARQPSLLGDRLDIRIPRPDPDAGRPEQDVTISPYAVGYHDSTEVCSACEYLKGEQCGVLKMHVDPQGHCNAFEAKSGDVDQPMEAEGNDSHGGYE